MSDNPLLERSSLPLEYPPFDRIENSHFEPAFEAGMAEHAAEVRAIAENEDDPDFQNVFVALERSGRLLERAPPRPR